VRHALFNRHQRRQRFVNDADIGFFDARPALCDRFDVTNELTVMTAG
jgi:hypothetical protein